MTAIRRICDGCGEPLGDSVHWIGGEPGSFHQGCLAQRLYLRAPAAEIDRLRQMLTDALPYVECVRDDDAYDAYGKRRAKVLAESIRAAIKSAEGAGQSKPETRGTKP